MIFTDHYPFVNRPLAYPNDAFEPYLTETTVRVHHAIQAQTYVDNLNHLLQSRPFLQEMTLEELLIVSGSMPANEGRAIQRNAGGVYNHRLYFGCLVPPEIETQPSDALMAAIANTYGDYESMITRFITVSLSIFGSGYAWLVLNSVGTLGMIVTVNQETPVPLNLCPLLNIDVWEHAYYLTHYYNRSAYLHNLSHVISWDVVSRRFETCMAEQLGNPLL